MKGWKTVAFGLAIGLLGAFSTPDMQAFVAAHIPTASGLVGLVVILLRAVTTSPIFKGE